MTPSRAQNESITVTGRAEPQTRDEIIRGFVKSYSSPSRMLGKIARWADPICPFTAGLKPEENAAVTARIKRISAAIGARTSKDPSCRVNITVMFASDPQDLLDNIRLHHVSMLGDVDSPSHARQLARMTHPVQAWYGTNIEDEWGQRTPSQPCWPDICYVISKGGHIDDGLKSVFTSALVIVDANQAKGHAVGSLADYVAMMALTQTKASDGCLALPSVTNLLTPDCDDSLKTDALSDADMGYLRGIYKMDPGLTLNMARGDIANEIEKTNAGR